MRWIFRAAVLAAFFCVPTAACAAKAELILFESPGCVYCKAWARDVGPGYGSSRAGIKLPLRRIDLSKGVPSDVHELMPVRGVPTFVVRACNHQMARFSGYRSKEQFYAMMDQVLANMRRLGC